MRLNKKGGKNVSKLYQLYQNLKKENPTNVYLFKSGIFYLALEEDANTLSNLFHFKLGKLNDNVIKCGFPCSSFFKYENLFKLANLSIQIIEDDTRYSLKDFSQNTQIKELLHKIQVVNADSLSVQEAYQFIEEIKELAKKIESEKIS